MKEAVRHVKGELSLHPAVRCLIYHIRHTPELYILASIAGHHMLLWCSWVRWHIGFQRAVRELSRLSLTSYSECFLILFFSTNMLSSSVHTSHSGQTMAHELQDSLKSYGIAVKLLGFVADSTSNNDTLTDNLHEQLPGWDGQHNRIRCLAHVINLVTKVHYFITFQNYLLNHF